jgi:hypothetical protein
VHLWGGGGPSVNAWQRIPRTWSGVTKLLYVECICILRVCALTKTWFHQGLGELRCRWPSEAVWMPPRLLRPAARRAQVGCHPQVCDWIGSEYLHKFMRDDLDRKVLPVEIETNDTRIHCAVREPLMPCSIFRVKKPTLLDRQSKCENFVLVKDVSTVWAMKGYY